MICLLVFLYMLIYKDRISIWVNNREARWTLLSSNRIFSYFYTFRLELLKQLAHIIKRLYIFSILIPSRIECQYIFFEHALE